MTTEGMTQKQIDAQIKATGISYKQLVKAFKRLNQHRIGASTSYEVAKNAATEAGYCW